jgi:hypothetical protein
MLAAIIALGLFAAPKPLPCPSHTLVQCVDTRALTAEPGFQPALRAFLGGSHERLLHGDRPLYDQVLELMAKPDGNSAPHVGADMRLYAGCRRMACPEKAAVIVGEHGIVAVGLIDYTHGDPGLEVIVRRSNLAAGQPGEALKVWAKDSVAQQAEHDHANTGLHGTRVRALDEEPPGGLPKPQRSLRGIFSLPRL